MEEIKIPDCPICEQPMVYRSGAPTGDPVFRCTTDDAAHRTAETKRKADGAVLLEEARQKREADAATEAQLAARFDPPKEPTP
jgi:hypothetical protein